MQTQKKMPNVIHKADKEISISGWGNIVGNYLLHINQYRNFLIATVNPISNQNSILAECHFSYFHLITRDLVKESMPETLPKYVLNSLYEGLYNKQRELYEKGIIQSNLRMNIEKLIKIWNVKEEEVSEIEDIIYYKNCGENLYNHFEPLVRMKVVSFLVQKELKDVKKSKKDKRSLINLKNSLLSLNSEFNWNSELIEDEEQLYL